MLDTEKVRINVYLSKRSKEKAQEVLKKYGLDISEALNLFLAVIAETGRLPSEFHVPNQATKKILTEVLAGKNLEETSLEEIFDEAQTAQAVRERCLFNDIFLPS